MKSSEVASKYGLFEFEVKQHIKKYAEFSFKENWWGEITIPDDVDIETFFKPLLLKKEGNKEALYLWEQEELDRQEQERHQKEELERRKREGQKHLRIDKLKAQNIDGYYEYKVISLSDASGLFKRNSGSVDIEAMTQTLNDLGLDGWHLVTAYSNELGKNALSGGVGGAILGANSTVDENILIFERFVKI